jgi:hypothetical protein
MSRYCEAQRISRNAEDPHAEDRLERREPTLRLQPRAMHGGVHLKSQLCSR